MFDSSASSSFVNLTTEFAIKYGSGQAAGVLAKDVIQMAGFSVSNQTFGALPMPPPAIFSFDVGC